MRSHACSLAWLPKFATEPETSDISFQVDEAEHFCRYAECGACVDRRDLGLVFGHEGELPHPAGDKPQ
jgi:hypothetical protein